MADAITIIKCPSEALKDFNQRLSQMCGENDVTNVQMAIIDGQPVVTLFSEMVEADEEDVEGAKEAGEDIKVGDLVPSEEPVVVQVCQVRAVTDEQAVKSQRRMGVLFQRADGAVTAILHASGKGLVQVEDPATKKQVMVEKDVHYAAVVFNAGDEEDTGSEGAPATAAAGE